MSAPAILVQFVELDSDGEPDADWRVVSAEAFPRAGESVWLPIDATGETEQLYTVARVEWSGEWPDGTPDDPGMPTLSPIHYVTLTPGAPMRVALR